MYTHVHAPFSHSARMHSASLVGPCSAAPAGLRRQATLQRGSRGGADARWRSSVWLQCQSLGRRPRHVEATRGHVVGHHVHCNVVVIARRPHRRGKDQRVARLEPPVVATVAIAIQDFANACLLAAALLVRCDGVFRGRSNNLVAERPGWWFRPLPNLRRGGLGRRALHHRSHPAVWNTYSRPARATHHPVRAWRRTREANLPKCPRTAVAVSFTLIHSLTACPEMAQEHERPGRQVVHHYLIGTTVEEGGRVFLRRTFGYVQFTQVSADAPPLSRLRRAAPPPIRSVRLRRRRGTQPIARI